MSLRDVRCADDGDASLFSVFDVKYVRDGMSEQLHEQTSAFLFGATLPDFHYY